jgi:uncharacterized GH25 family protein
MSAMNHLFTRRVLTLTAALFALAPLGAHAHRTWLLPSATLVDGAKANVSIDAAVSEDLFEFDTVALALDTLVITAPDGSSVAPESRTAGKRRTTFELPLAQKGTYRIAGVSDTAMASYKLGGETKRWRGSPDAVAKEIPADATDVVVTRMHSRVETFVTNDTPSAKAVTPTGVGLELVPMTNPTDLSAGDSTRFQLLLDGKPAANADVTVIRGGNRYRYKLGEIGLKTDAQGGFSVKWAEAGRYWIGASAGGRGPGGAGAASAPPSPPAPPARRVSYSGTFEVLPK